MQKECAVSDCEALTRGRHRFCSKHETQLAGVALPITKAQRKTRPISDRLASRLKETANGCLEFQGARTNGYGYIAVNSFPARAHRVAWELANGPIPAGLQVCHTCDNPPCCNVDHLFLGRPQDNSADMVRKGRHQSSKQGAK